MKKLLLLALITALTGYARASFLYWQVDNDTESSYTYNYARVMAKGADGGAVMLALADPHTGDTEADTGWVSTQVGAVTYNVINLAQIGNDATYSFYIELVNFNESTGEGDWIRRSEEMTWAQLSANHYIDDGLSASPSATWHGSGYSTVPEPTSALLLIVGAGLLALRRREFTEG